MELCGPAGCGFVEGEEECFDRTQTVVGDRPEESCSLDPQITCKHVTKLAPQLEEVEVCFDVPKEVCTRSEVNPRKVAQPVLKKWCYVVTCEDECVAAAAKGECLPQCETYRGDARCCAPCPKVCLDAATAGQQCSSQCQRYSDNPKCCYSQSESQSQSQSQPQVTTRRPIRTTTRNTTTRRTTPGRTTGRTTRRTTTRRPVTTTTRGRPTTTRRTTRRTTQGRTTRRPSAPGTEPNVADLCPTECAKAFNSKQTVAGCKQYKDTYNNCFYEKCSDDCKASAGRGESNPDCRQHLGDKECYSPPTTCPVKCQKDAALGFCSSSCKEFEGNPDCCAPKCPAKCTNKRR